MNKYTLKKEIMKEIKNINTLIDMRIIKGISYKDLSRRHKFLISELNSLAMKQYSYVKTPKPVPVLATKAPVKTSDKNLFSFFGMLGRYVTTFIF